MKLLKFFIIWGAAPLLVSGCAHRLPEKEAVRRFSYQTDRFAYANETVWTYENGRPVQVRGGKADSGDHSYTTHCFVVTRSAVQFWKFARFEPAASKLSDRELAKRVKALAAIQVWKDPYPEQKRIVFPGYANLHELSADKPIVLQDNLGQGWPIFVRPGNTCMVFPPSRAHQERTFEELKQGLALKYPMIVWLVTFPDLGLNHSLLVYAMGEKRGKTVFTVYDPNNVKTPETLEYNPATRTFSFQKTFYFPGGPVDVRTIYWSPMQ